MGRRGGRVEGVGGGGRNGRKRGGIEFPGTLNLFVR